MRWILPLLLLVPAVAQDRAAALLRSLSLEQKAGQLFVSWSLSRKEGDNHARLLANVRDAQLGGVILSLGTVADAADLVPRLQAQARTPLLLAGDFEGGVWWRLAGATQLGNQMLVGATASAALAEVMGADTARQGKALGFHWLFAPVLDVNSNPSNPIINVRSFGQEPELVAELGAAFARGVRAQGLIACGKHFPGHGDVDSDSHLSLPTVPGDAARLRQVELLPFARLAREGLESVMTGHLAVPGLGEAADVPATLSARILRGVLRDELGFTGLVVTDALEMGGVRNRFAPGEVAVRALLAGADVLLMPPDPLAARLAVVEAVQSGRVPQARLDDAVQRILAMKERVGLLAGQGLVQPDWPQQVRSSEQERHARSIAARGLVLVRDRGGLLPLAPSLASKTLLLSLHDRAEVEGAEFLAQMRGSFAQHAALAGDASAAELAAAAAQIAASECVVLALFVKVREYEGKLGLPPRLLALLAGLADHQQVIGVSFGSPYLLAQLPQVDSYLAAFVATAATEAAAAQALRGKGWLVGQLPVEVPGVAALGTGLRLYPRTLPDDAAATMASSLAAELPDQLRSVLQRGVDDGAYSGAVCAVGRHGVPLVAVAVGKLRHDAAAAPVTVTTPFDLASLTKVCATTPAVLKLVAAGKLALSDRVGQWLPEFVGVGKQEVTIGHLLAHCGGLPGYERYYRSHQGSAAILSAAAREGLMYEPGSGTTYSDLGFMLLMQIVERCSGEPFAQFVAREVFAPFGMLHAGFAPTAGPPRALAAATELDAARGGVLCGYVHDENAFAMGGISGHAGLFATANDVLQFGMHMLGGGSGVLPRSLVEQATQSAGLVRGDASRGLGFQMLTPGWAGSAVNPGTFGHTGFTGTSLHCDPTTGVVVALLTNRVHPTRVNQRIVGVRQAVHDLVRASLR